MDGGVSGSQLLLIESNPLIVRIVSETLAALNGVQLLSAADWHAAVVAVRDQGPFQWIVLEPRIDGCLWTLAVPQLRALQPAARLVALGERVNEIEQCLRQVGVGTVLSKQALLEDPLTCLAHCLELNIRPGAR